MMEIDYDIIFGSVDPPSSDTVNRVLREAVMEDPVLRLDDGTLFNLDEEDIRVEG